MRALARRGRKRLFVPEVVQTSMMDCGPASLKALLGGFGVHVSYGRLREACQTDVDGTSIDTLEELAVELGLDAEQVMVPPEHILLGEAQLLPAITVVRLPGGLTHFVVAWNQMGGRVQVMDPASGRRWQDHTEFLQDLYLHTMPVPAAAFREFAESDAFLKPVDKRMRMLGASSTESKRLVTSALASDGWRDLAALEAGIRMVESLVESGGVARGADAMRLVTSLYETYQKDPADELIPAHLFTARPAPPDENGDEQVYLRGAVLVRVSGLKATAEGDQVPAPRLSPEVAAAIAEKPVHPARELWHLLRQDGLLAPSILATALAMGALVRTIEIILIRGLLRVSDTLVVAEQRAAAVIALVVFFALALVFEWSLASGLIRLGRKLEMRLRMAFFRKIPRLGDRYFQSRPISDMAHRSHALQAIRELPTLGATILRSACDLVMTAGAIVWIDPKSAPLAALAAAIAIAVPMLLNGPLVEQDLRLRTHAGALVRFYLDALLGLVPIRAHAAERSIRREHESLLVEWVLANRTLVRTSVTTEAVMGLAGFGIAVFILAGALGRGVPLGQAILLLYWALGMPIIGQTLAQTAREYPNQRNTTLRLLEPLGAVEETTADATEKANGASDAPAGHGVRIELDGVQVKAGGHVIIDEATLAIEAGSHVAIVGPSGAGKSSLVGLLLGWHKPTTGNVHVDGMPLDGERLDRLRKETVWLDPAVQLWNRSFLDNLRYGSDGKSPPLAGIVDDADLFGLLERLPEGQATVLGEGGALVSGGEGQRVRFGRALHKADARLVILDEPFRGLDRDKRRECLTRARRRFVRATFLCITHDVGETRDFDRVLVIEGGRIVEDASPHELEHRPDSRYRALLDAEEALRRDLWAHPSFRRLRVDRGKLAENAERGAP